MDGSTLLATRYELGDLLGSGGMADVYAARDRLLNRDVAIKFFRALDRQADRARFVSEARMLAGLSHPGLVTVYDASFEEQRTPYLIMRLVDGGTLRQILDAGPLPPDQVAMLGARLATALAHVHAKGIVHRDVKPSNVLVDSGGEHYLADFGLAWALGSAHLTNSGELVGTACYLAPEQVAGAVVDQKADIYALGLVLLECLTGRTEYHGSDVEVAVARLSRPPVVPEEYGPSWHRLLTAMTDSHPSNRPDALECARRLRAIARGPATATVVRPRIERRGLARVGKARAGIGAAGMVLTALMLAFPTTTAGTPVPAGAPSHPATARPTAPPPATPSKTAAPNTHRPHKPKTQPAAPATHVEPTPPGHKHRPGPKPGKPGKPK